MTTVDALHLRRTLGRELWLVPIPFGPDGWKIDRADGTARVITTCSPAPPRRSGPHDETEWVHASMSVTDRVPTYDELTLLHRAVFRDGYAYQVFAPAREHVNIHEFALHLWGRADGRPGLPDFGWLGTI